MPQDHVLFVEHHIHAFAAADRLGAHASSAIWHFV